MAETHSLRLEIDGAAARRGAADYAAALKRIESATQGMVSSTDSALARLERRMGKLNFSKVATDLSKLASVNINRQSVAAVDALSKSLSGFIGVRPAAIKTVTDFAAALRSVNTAGINIAHLNAISGSLSSFRAPTQTQVRNLQSFVGVLQNLQPPPNANSVVASLQRITTAVNNLRAAMQGLNTGGPGTLRLPNVAGGAVGTGTAPRGGGGGGSGGWTYAYGGTLRRGSAPIPAYMGMGPGRSSVAGMRGFENQFSLPYQAGTAIRSAAGALTIGNLLQQIIEATDNTQKFRSSLIALGQSSEDVEAQMARVRDVVRQYGMNLRETQEMYSSFIHAVTSTGVELDNAEGMFNNAALSMRAMGMDRVQQEGALRALGQMFSKGRIMSEELFGQLAEHWRGFPGMIAQSLGVTLPQLREAIEKNGLDPRVLELVLERYRQSMEGAVDAALNRPTVAIERLRTEWQLLLSEMGEGDVGRAITSELTRLRDIVASPEFRDFAFKIGMGLADVIRAVGSAAFWASQNTETLGTVLKALVIVAGANALIGLGGAFANLARPLMVVAELLRSVSTGLASAGAAAGTSATAMGGLRVVLGSLLRFFTGPVGASLTILSGLAGAIAYVWDETLTWGQHTATVGDVIKTMWSDAVGWVTSFTTGAWAALSEFGASVLAMFSDIGTSVRSALSTTVAGRAVLEAARGAGQAASFLGRQASSAASWVAGRVSQSAAPTIDGVMARAAALTAARVAEQAEQERTAAAARSAANERAFATAERAAQVDAEYLPLPPIPPANIRDFLLNNGRGTSTAERTQERFENFRGRLDPSYRVGEELDDGLALISGARSRGQITATEAVELQQRLRNSILETAGALDPTARAQERLNEITAIANGLVQRGIIDGDRRNQIVQTARLNLEEQLDPYAYQLRLMREETDLLSLSSREMETEQRVRRMVNELKRQGVTVTGEMTEALRREAEAQRRAQQAQRDREEGLSSWANSFRSLDVELRKLEATIAMDLTDTLAEFVTTGKANFSDLANSIVRDINRLIIQNGLREMFSYMGLIGGDPVNRYAGPGLFGMLFAGLGGAAGINSVTDPGAQSVSQLLAGIPVQKEGGLVTNPVSRGVMPASAFVNAPHYAEGTPNTRGGIPAVLHPNEAVIPLSRNRRVPVEMRGGGGGNTIVMNVNTPDADSFRRSERQIIARVGSALAREGARGTA